MWTVSELFRMSLAEKCMENGAAASANQAVQRAKTIPESLRANVVDAAEKNIAGTDHAKSCRGNSFEGDGGEAVER
jgi:hypothetical protein